MLFSGNCFELKKIEGTSFLELSINLKKESVNKFNAETVAELQKALLALQQNLSGTRGLLLASHKDAFLAGADITEFLEEFKKSEKEIADWISVNQGNFNQLEDLNFPTVCILSGFALGGGLEFALTCDFRIATPGTKIGLPETKLGIIPGWGGTVRLPRLIGADPALEWITSGNQFDSNDALKVGVIDAIVAPVDLRAAGIDLLTQCMNGKINWQSRKERKKSKLQLNATERAMSFSINRAGVLAVAGPHYPAPLTAVDVVEKSADLTRDEALKNEADAFGKLCKSTQARALVGIFLADQSAKKKAKGARSLARPIQQSAVLGAGIMGGGIAYQSAYSKIPILMKDIKPEALAHGIKEASNLLEKQIQRGKMTIQGMGEVLSRITPTIRQEDLKPANFVIEAVTENEKVKIAVLKEMEDTISPEAILTSNTSTISITGLATQLKRPEKFCGMHFFNPVPKMPLVEIIRGAKTAPETIATAVMYASAMGKIPIVVNDCPGFLVNRVLFAYFTAFNQLVAEKVDFTRIDKLMEKWGWPMGPAYLLDVVGVDTAHHAAEVMSKGFPDRMQLKPHHAVTKMYQAGRYGQKNGKGFYNYSVDSKGKPKKETSPEVYALMELEPAKLNTAITDTEIVDRLMVPFVLESARCLAEKIVDTAEELDLAMLNGLGFPPFRGGPMRYAQSVGAGSIIEKGNAFTQKHGALYEIPAAVQEVLKHV